MEISEDRVRYWSNVSCILCFIISALFMIQILDGLPRFANMYKALRVELPILTRVVLNMYPHWIVGFATAFCVAKQFGIKDPVKSLNYNILQVILVLVLKEIYSYAMFAPILLIQDALSKK